jgi:ADP-ribosylglycohydrolase
VREMVDGGTWNILAGQPTDDSELALILARTLVRERAYDPRVVLQSYLYWYLSRPFDVGSTIGAALEAAGHGKSEDERLQLALQHASHGSQANGSLMRISPLGIFAAGSPEAGIRCARADSRLTHPHPVCQDACAVYTAALAHAVAEGGLPRQCFRAALDLAERLGVRAEVKQALAAAEHGPPEDYQRHQGWVLIALRNAFFQLLHAPNLEEGLVATVMAGGDTDTNAAIAGALLGAVYGHRALPPRWVQAVLSCRPLRRTQTAHPRPTEFWPVDALELAEALLLGGEQSRSAIPC